MERIIAVSYGRKKYFIQATTVDTTKLGNDVTKSTAAILAGDRVIQAGTHG